MDYLTNGSLHIHLMFTPSPWCLQMISSHPTIPNLYAHLDLTQNWHPFKTGVAAVYVLFPPYPRPLSPEG